MRVFRFLLPAALAALLVWFVPCRASWRGALAEAGPAQADAPEGEGTAEQLAVAALRLALVPVEALSRAFTDCEEKQGEDAPGWIREGAELLRALLAELRELLPDAPEDGPEGDISVILPSPFCKLRLV